MHKIDTTPMTSAFQSCWYAAAKHLEAQGQGGINWLRAHPFPPYLEHLSEVAPLNRTHYCSVKGERDESKTRGVRA